MKLWTAIPRAMSKWRGSRYRKTKTVGVLLVVVLAVRLVWGWWVGREMQAVLEDLRQRGEPTSLSQLTIPVVSESQNAWYFQAQAVRALSTTAQMPRNPRNSYYPTHPPYSAEWMKQGEALERANAAAFALARQASGCSMSQMREGYDLSRFGLLFISNASYVRPLAEALANGAIFAQLNGEDVEAIDRVCDVLKIARTFQDDHAFSFQVADGGHTQQLACYSAQVIAPELSLDANVASRAATTQRVRQLIDELLDERPARDALRSGMLLDLLNAIDRSAARAQGAWLTRPLADHDIGRWKGIWEVLDQASRCDNNADAQAIVARRSGGTPMRDEYEVEQPLAGLFDGSRRDPPRLPRYSRRFREFTWTQASPAPGSFVLWFYFQTLAERRVTAVSLACQLYRADHGGWPERLEQLAPGYLPAVPADPFQNDGRPLGYLVLKNGLPDGGDRPVVYYDLVYPGDKKPDSQTAVPAGPLYGAMDHRPRIHHDIAGFQPSTRSSTKAVDDQPEKPETPRDEAK